jgi:threonine/homoserine/homoserine lactone efflux protein
MIYGVTALSSYILPHFKGSVVLVFFCFLLAFVGFLCTLLWSSFGALFNKLFSQYAKVVNTVMALLLIYCAVSLFL